MEFNDLSVMNQQALILAVRALHADDSRMLVELGLVDLDEQLTRQLKTLQIDHLACVASFRGSLCQLRIDPSALRLCLGFVEGKTKEEEMLNRAIRGGLRQPMLETLKGIGRREYNSRRDRMGLPDHSKGRIELLSEEDEIRVLRTWEALKGIDDPLERLVLLHEDTGISLDQAWVTIKQLS